jgi:hypothetical protein
MKINTDRKRLRNSTGDRTAELNIHLEDPVSRKIVQHELHKSNIHGRAVIAKPLITESNVQMRCPSCYFLQQQEFAFGVLWCSPNGNSSCLQSGMSGSNSETRRRFCDGSDSNIVIWHSVDPIITLHARTTAKEYVDKLGNQVHRMMQTLFSNNDAVFPDDNTPIHTAGTVQSWFEEHEGELQHLP